MTVGHLTWAWSLFLRPLFTHHHHFQRIMWPGLIVSRRCSFALSRLCREWGWQVVSSGGEMSRRQLLSSLPSPPSLSPPFPPTLLLHPLTPLVRIVRGIAGHKYVAKLEKQGFNTFEYNTTFRLNVREKCIMEAGLLDIYAIGCLTCQVVCGILWLKNIPNISENISHIPICQFVGWGGTG